jgi:CubicO group peptidase (beta-lactamase class C family)
LDLDAPVVEYWPEFGAAGKEHIPVRWLLSRQAGLACLDGPLTFGEAYAWDPVIRALEAQKPEWEPGTEHVYHSVTFGYLVGEIVGRITGKSLGTFSPWRSLPRSGYTPGSGCLRSKSQMWHRSIRPPRSRWRR